MATSARTEDAAAAAAAHFLTFALGPELYALDIRGVREIIQVGPMTPVPLMPGFVRGVINLRGSVVPVIDLAARFGGRQTESSRRTCIVIIELTSAEERHDIGVVVDAVSEVLEVPSADIEPAPSFGARIRADFMEGMGKIGGKFVIILNIQRVLSVEEVATLATVSQHVAEEAGAEA